MSIMRLIGVTAAVAILSAAPNHAALAAERDRAPATLLPPASAPAPVPDADSLARAQRMVREVFAADFLLNDRLSRRALARRLIDQAADTADEPAARFALLSDARDVAAAAGDAHTATRAIRQLARSFAVDPLSMTLAALMAARRAADSPQLLAAVASAALDAIDMAVAADDYAAASRLADLAEQAATAARHVSLTLQSRQRNAEVATIRQHYERSHTARDLLQQRDDPQAHLALGWFLCCIKNDWNAGLPHLAGGSDEPLKRLASRELSHLTDSDRYEIAGDWWDLAQRLTGLTQRHVYGHAAEHYRQALPALTGLRRSLAESRIGQADAAALVAMGLRPGLAAELHRGTTFSSPVAMRVDAQVDFDWGEDAPDESTGKDNFSIRWSGLLRVREAGRYELVLVANAGARLWVDGRLVADEPNLSRLRNGVRVPLDLAAGLHALRLDYWDTTGIARMRLLWRPPAASRDQPVPPDALLHEGGG